MRIDYEQLEFIHPTLRKLMRFVEGFGVEFTTTSLYRIGDRGVHGQLPLRGVDLRMHADEVGRVVEQVVNEAWAYDPDRPGMRCAVYHDGGSGAHLHLQVHPRTARR